MIPACQKLKHEDQEKRGRGEGERGGREKVKWKKGKEEKGKREKKARGSEKGRKNSGVAPSAGCNMNCNYLVTGFDLFDSHFRNRLKNYNLGMLEEDPSCFFLKEGPITLFFRRTMPGSCGSASARDLLPQESTPTAYLASSFLVDVQRRVFLFLCVWQNRQILQIEPLPQLLHNESTLGAKHWNTGFYVGEPDTQSLPGKLIGDLRRLLLLLWWTVWAVIWE